MLRWNASIYMDEKVKKKPMRYRKMLERKKIVRGCYVITLPVSDKNCLELYHSREFWFRYYRTKVLEIVGIAADRESAQELLCTIAQDVLDTYGEFTADSVRRYFSR